ncbi:sugar ABC transporter permease [Thioclava sp. BHET1]|nr:sugar ABC transporter permease [Thioclava sp. BHET1]
MREKAIFSGATIAQATFRATGALLLREMATSYGRSPGGYLWAVLEPLGGIAILSAAFSAFLHRPALGENFPLFYATAILPFLAFQGLCQKTAQALQYSRPLLTYPVITHIDAIFARFLLGALTHLIVFILVICGLQSVYGLRLQLDFAAILNALAMTAALGLGLGTLFCFLRSALPLWDTLWSIINRPLFLMSGVFYLYDGLPLPLRGWLWWNPLLQISGEMRQGFYPGYNASYVSPAYVYAVALTAFTTGLLLLHRRHRDLLNR